MMIDGCSLTLSRTAHTVATAKKLSADGAKVVVNDLDTDVAEACAQRIRDIGGEAIAVAGDVTDGDFTDQLIQTSVDAFGQIDIVVNNAGYIWNGAMHNHSDEQFQAMLDMRIAAPFKVLRSFFGWLKPQVQQLELCLLLFTSADSKVATHW